MDEKNESHIQNEIKNLITQTQTNILSFINDSYNKEPKLKYYYTLNNVEKWKISIEQKIKQETDKLIIVLKEKVKKDKITANIKEGNKNNINNNNKKVIKIENQSTLKYFTSKDIQAENKEITRNFENKALSYLDNPNEKVDNETISIFLKKVARISRIAYNEGKKLLEKMKEKYRQEKHFINYEKSRKEISSWVRSFEKEKGKKEYENIIGQVKLFEEVENNDEQKYLTKLFYDLTTLYFHCNLAFPLVSINFIQEIKFNSDKMIDFINKGNDRKVNFVILPSLFSNGNYLENGKSWVFTYLKDTFKFEESEIESLNKLIDKEKKEILISEKSYNELNIQFSSQIKKNEKIINIKSNKNIFENKDIEIVLYLINKKTNKNSIVITRKNIVKLDVSQDIKKYEVIKVLFSSENIKIN